MTKRFAAPVLSPEAVVSNGVVELGWMKSTPLFEADDKDEFSRIRIFRAEVPFVFGKHYEEFFLDMDAQRRRPIFDGALTPTNNRRYVFADHAVEAGRTYAYWIRTRNSRPIGPIPARMRDPRVWWPYRETMRRLEALRDKSPRLVKLSVCGRTARGIDIPCVRIGRGSRLIGLVGAIHGGESGPELIVPTLARLAKECPELLRRVGILAVPSVNIDSREAEVRGAPWYIRRNHNGVDLNRNFPAQWDTTDYSYGMDSSREGSHTYRGPEPASEPETRAVLAAFEHERPDVVFSFHSLASICGLPALAAKTAADSKSYALRCKRLVEVFGKAFYPEPRFAGNWLAFGCTAGSLPAWFFEHGGIPAFDLESGADPEALAVCGVDKTDVKLLRNYQARHFAGIKAVLEVLAREKRRSGRICARRPRPQVRWSRGK